MKQILERGDKMPIYFRSMPSKEPFFFESIGNHWDQEQVVRPNGHPLYHYLQTEKGRGRIEIQGKTYYLESGEGMLIAPSVKHSYMRETEEWTTLFATVTGTIESSINAMLGNRKVIFVKKEQGMIIEQLVSEIVKECEKNTLGGKQLSIACYDFLMNFVDGVYETEQLTDQPLYRQYVEPIIKEIETNYNEKLTVSGLADQVYVTQQYLSRLFRRFMGCSICEYILAFRISKAKELLIQRPQVEIRHISYQVGFEDASHFIAMFKKTVGMTPGEFRLLHKMRR